MFVDTRDLELTHIPPVQTAMLVRRPPHEVFQALVDPAITTKFWFTKSSGRVEPGADLRWDWEMYGASVDVSVKKVEADRQIVFEWGERDARTTVELRLTPWDGDATYVEVTESGLSGDADAIVAKVADSMGGFTIVLCALKALLEHDVVLTAVGDRHPDAADH